MKFPSACVFDVSTWEEAGKIDGFVLAPPSGQIVEAQGIGKIIGVIS